jgi:hypothetical protein
VTSVWVAPPRACSERRKSETPLVAGSKLVQVLVLLAQRVETGLELRVLLLGRRDLRIHARRV